VTAQRYFSQFQPHLHPLERQNAPCHDHLTSLQPFMQMQALYSADRQWIQTCQETSNWQNLLTREQAAYALAQVTASRALPSMSEYVSVVALLESQLRLRDHLNDRLVEIISDVLHREGSALHWNKLDESVFCSVIGWGVALCVDTAPECETLYLRFADHIATAISAADRRAELPRSVIGIETNICERFEVILERARAILWSELELHYSGTHEPSLAAN
jgi:hypothetical protein